MALKQHYEDENVSLPELARGTDVIDGLEFDNCNITGPAVLVFLENVSIVESQLPGDPDAFIWVVPDERRSLIGAIGLRNCSFRHCRFDRVGIAGTQVVADQLKKSALQS